MGADKPWQHGICRNSKIPGITLPACESNSDRQRAIVYTLCLLQPHSNEQGLSDHKMPRAESGLLGLCCPSLSSALPLPGTGCVHGGNSSFCFPYSAAKKKCLMDFSSIKVSEMLLPWYRCRFLYHSSPSRVSLEHFLSRQEVAMDKELVGGEKACYDSLIKVKPVPSCPPFPGDPQGLWGGFSILSMNCSLKVA